MDDKLETLESLKTELRKRDRSDIGSHLRDAAIFGILGIKYDIAALEFIAVLLCLLTCLMAFRYHFKYEEHE